jgi:hypothetical protein
MQWRHRVERGKCEAWCRWKGENLKTVNRRARFFLLPFTVAGFCPRDALGRTTQAEQPLTGVQPFYQAISDAANV